MARLTSSEQARLEQHLAAAHRHISYAANLFQARDAYVEGDELAEMAVLIGAYMAEELKRGRALRTR